MPCVAPADKARVSSAEPRNHESTDGALEPEPLLCAEPEPAPEPEEEEEEEDALPPGWLPRVKAGEAPSHLQKKIRAAQGAEATPLDSDLLVHRSGLEQAAAAARAKAAAGAASPRCASKAARLGPSAPLGADLLVHRSGLEQAKAAASAKAAAGAASPHSRVRNSVASTAPLGAELKVHKSGLELAKEAAAAAAAEGGAGGLSRAAKREADEWAQWGGQPIGNLVVKHESKMEREVRLWKEAAAKAAGKGKETKRTRAD
jgi:hypothetical protein